MIFHLCDVVMSWRHDVMSWRHENCSMLWPLLIKWSKHPCIHGQRFVCLVNSHTNIDGVSFVTSYSYAMTSWRHSVTLWHNHICKYNIYDIFELFNPEYYRNKKKNHIASTSTSWDRYSLFNDVMTSFRDVIPSCKCDNNNQIEFSHQRNHRMESALEHIYRLRWRQFISWRHVVILMTSWRHVSDVMTSRYDIKTSCKYIHDISFQHSDRNNYRNTRVSSL